MGNDENEHKFSLKTISIGVYAEDELYIVEAGAMNCEAVQLYFTDNFENVATVTGLSWGSETPPPVVLWLSMVWGLCILANRTQ